MIDGEGNPISGVPLKTATFSHWESGEGFGTDVADVNDTISDLNGLAVINQPSKTGAFSIYALPVKDYYGSSGCHYKFDKVVGGKWIPDNPTIPYVLKKKRNPIPLYAKNLTEGLLVPVLGQRCGYDFKIGDWKAPHGKGEIADIYFVVQVSEEPNGDFDSLIEVTFPNEKDGLIFFEQNRFKGSELVSDYLAPMESYKPQKNLRRFSRGGRITSEINKETGNYYLRLRTRVDEKGNIKSANYAKLYGDFMYFTYYFNPTPNDRNLEFDPERNLFTDLKPNERVSAP